MLVLGKASQCMVGLEEPGLYGGAFGHCSTEANCLGLENTLAGPRSGLLFF